MVSSRRVRKGPGRRPMSAKLQQFLKLLARGWTAAAARREVGISRSASRNWRYGYKVYLKDGTVRFVPPLDPLTTRAISARFLSEGERVGIADRHHAGKWCGRSAAVGRAPSTVSRELRRNCARTGRYHPFEAHRAAALRRRRLRPTKLATHPALLAVVKDRLAQRWSPPRSAALYAASSPTGPPGTLPRRRSTRSSTALRACCCVALRPLRCAPAVITAAPTSASPGDGGALVNPCSACTSAPFLPRTAPSPAIGRVT